MQDSLAVEVGIMLTLALVSLPCSSCFNILFSKKKFTSHKMEMNKDQTSCILWCLLQPLLQELKKKSGLSKHMLLVHEAGYPSKILQDINLAKFIAHSRISFAICYSRRGSASRSTHAKVKGVFVKEFMLLLDLCGVPSAREI